MIFNMSGGGAPSLPQYAAIAVNYFPGLVVTCSDGITTLTAPDTSGTAIFVVPYAATWTVTDGTRTKSVSITDPGQLESVNIGETVLWYRGFTTLANFRTMWRYVNNQAQTTINVSGTDYYTFTSTNSWAWQMNTKVDLTDFSTFRVYGYRGSSGNLGFNTSNTAGINTVTQDGKVTLGTTDGIYEADISSLTGQYYLGIYVGNSTAYIKKVALI